MNAYGNSILITGGAGFIGFHLAKKLLEESDSEIVIIDNLNDYYSPQLKRDRLRHLGVDEHGESGNERLSFYEIDIADGAAVDKVFDRHAIDTVIHLAAQAGVRYSLVNPKAYIDSNLVGHFNILNNAARHDIKLFMYASSSSVYGDTKLIPFVESSPMATPLSLYAATKMCDELLSTTYSHTYKMHCIGLRFFNAYGPWGRPDAAYYIWSEALRLGKPVEVRGEGLLRRDMTFIEDAVRSVLDLVQHYRQLEDTEHVANEVFNIGNHNPVVMHSVLDHLAGRLHRKPLIEYVAKGEEEIELTNADTSKLQRTIGFAPDTPIRKGLDAFVDWYAGYYHYSV